MAFVITEPCIGTTDQACVSVCPVDCIHFEEGKDQMLYINPAECIDCGACQPACPVSAIFPEGDVPEASAKFIAINALWYEDPDAARTQVGGGAPAPAPVPAAAAPAASADASAQDEAPAEAAAAAPAPAAAPAATPAVAATAAPAAPVPPVTQVPAAFGVRAPEVSTYILPPVLPVAILALIGACFFAMFVFPGPIIATITWADDIFRVIRIDNGGRVGITVMALLPVIPILILLWIIVSVPTFSRFAASHERGSAEWRRRYNEWRRNEESRRYNLVEVVQAIAHDRFNFPDDRNPDLQTYVNLPAPTMGVEVRGSGDKFFPDIVTVAQPGFYPVALAQVESKETVSREQATYVWSMLENRDCPVYIYVPAGRLGTAKDYARSAGLKNVKFRTWRWSPNGMVVKEV